MSRKGEPDFEWKNKRNFEIKRLYVNAVVAFFY